jgi:hypothetical protein
LIFGEPSRERRDSLATARVVVQQTVADLKDNIAAARERAYGLLSAQQLTRAQEIEEKAERAILDEERKGDKGKGGTPPPFSRPPA